jgi:hypothetical protein
VCGGDNKYSGDVIIPDYIMYDGRQYAVVGIIWSAFSSCTNLTSVTIVGNIESIGERAFEGCTSLTSVKLNYGGNYIFSELTTIGSDAFSYCTKLSGDLVIPDSVKWLSEYWLRGSNGNIMYNSGTDRLFINLLTKQLLTTDTHPNRRSPIGDYLGFAEVHIDDLQQLFESNISWIKIAGNASRCWKLFVNGVETRNIVIHCPQTHTAYNSSLTCSNITSVVVEEGITSVGSFDLCASLAFIDLPSTTTSIGMLRNTKGTLICRATNPPTL